jgi:hypothetical protein
MDAKSMAAAILLFSIGAANGNEPQNACGVAAMTDYTKANLALMQQSSPALSVEATIAQRRLEEEFCLRFVRCVLDDENSLRFTSAFDTCLRDEALEKYDAVGRDIRN